MNEKVFIICIELNSKKAISSFELILNQFGNWINIIPGTYALKGDFSWTSDSIRNAIFNRFTNQCKLLIMKSSIDASWNLSAEADGWMKAFI